MVSHNDWLCVVDESYIRDSFNLFGLSTLIPNYQDALRLVLGNYYDPEEPLSLIHARFILTVAACDKQWSLPIGITVQPGETPVNTFCPCCRDIYESKMRLDGACFGPSFPPFFLHALHAEITVEPLVPTQFNVFDIPVVSTHVGAVRSKHVGAPPNSLDDIILFG
jgi:casein kinase II subunit beta